ncbi:MAG: ATP-grasp domain-containing protein [bacterium]|nr:ATP-grasp domain-containing protein [bacterium]
MRSIPTMHPTEIKDLLNPAGSNLIYLANDVYSGLGLENLIDQYRIISIDYSPAVDSLTQRGMEIFSLEKATGINTVSRNTYHLLSHPKTINYLKNIPGEIRLLLFKPSARTNKIAREHGWPILSVSPQISRALENKLKFIGISEKAGVDCPVSKIIRLTEQLSYQYLRFQFGDPFVIQIGKGFGGRGTFFVRNESEFEAVRKELFGKRVKVSEYLDGLTLTLNACLTKLGTVASKPFLQITGVPECAGHPGSSCGNAWGMDLPDQAISRTFDITLKVADSIAEDGYRGIFGLDFILHPSGKVYLVEINPRLTNSIPIFTKLQLISAEVPLLALHIMEFLDLLPVKREIPQRAGNIKSGGQLILHNLEGKTCKVGRDFMSGIYRLEEDQLKRLREGYSIEDCYAEDEFLIITAPNGKQVNPNIECARIQTRGQILDSNLQVKPELRKMVRQIYTDLSLVP